MFNWENKSDKKNFTDENIFSSLNWFWGVEKSNITNIMYVIDIQNSNFCKSTDELFTKDNWHEIQSASFKCNVCKSL